MPDLKPTVMPLPLSGPGSAVWWKSQLDWATEERRRLLPKWRANAQAYRNADAKTTDIRVNIDFEKTEQKKYQLFYRLPAIKLRPSPRTTRDAQLDPENPRNLKRAVAIFKEVVTRLMGEDGANCSAMMGEVLFDVLCPSGIGFCKVGYERFEGAQPLQVSTGAMIDDPNFQQPPGSILGLSPAPQIPEVLPAPNVIAEKYYASRISPALGIIPPEFRGSDYARDCDYLGHDFPMLESAAKEKGWTVDAVRTVAKGDASFDDDRIVPLDRQGHRTGQVWCREVFYYASRLDPSERNPFKIRRIVFVHGQPDPVVHEDYTGQRFDPNGKFLRGVRTLPIKVLALRYVSDSAHPPSDCQITRDYATQLSEFRTGQVEHRRKAIPRVAIDVSRISTQAIKDKVLKGEHYDDIPVDGNPQNVAAEIGRPSYPQENWRTNDALMDDTNRAWALGANQSSTTEATGTTATEIAAIGQATANRLGGEREIVVSKFLMGIAKDLGAMFQLYGDHEDYVEILGEHGTRQVEAFTNADVLGEFLFDVVPDSSLAPDASADRDLVLNLYNLVRNDVNFDQLILGRQVAEAYNQDPDQLVKAPQPPQPPPPQPPSVGVSLKGDDLNPLAPQYANVVNLLRLSGIDPSMLSAVPQSPEGQDQITPAPVVDRERLRMAMSDEGDHRSPRLSGVQ